jgi:hypothetical protein
MRDLIDLIKTLEEARGLSARKPGETFNRIGGDTADDVITFNNMTFYPEVGTYESAEEMMAVFDQVQKQLGHPVEMVNQPNSRMGAFAVVAFDTAVGTRYLAKFAQDIKPVREKNTFFQTKDIPGNFSQTGARGSKEKAGYKPSDVLTDFKSQTPASILAQIEEKFGADSAEYQAAVVFNDATGFPIEIPAGNMDFKGFRDYFCEMLQPIALINGLPVKGNAGQAAATFMGQKGFSDCVVSFNQGVGGGLYDSLLVNPKNSQIKLSSKGAKGAMASVVNILTSVRELERAGMTQFGEQYADVIEILKTIDEGNHDSGPLNLAVQFDIISPTEVDQVMSLKKYAGDKNFNIDNTDVSDNLKKLYKERKAADVDKVIPLNHMVSSIAYNVVNKINMETNFSEAAADILNNSAFVQMYTDAKDSGDTFVITGFTTVWPSKLFTEVTLEAQKSYSSTASSSGKLVFNINKEPRKVANTETATDNEIVDFKADPDKLDAYAQQRTGVTAAAGGIKEPKKLGSEKTLGRKRQK